MARRVRIVDRNDLILRVRMASTVQLFDDARQNLRTLIETYGRELTKEERNLFAVFYKELLAKFRKEYALYVNLQKEIPPSQRLKHRLVRNNMYRARYEVATLCEEVIEVANNFILGTRDIEMQIYFMKLVSDYYRYWAEVAGEDQFVDLRIKAENAYNDAYDLANRKLDEHNPLRLGLMLNMSLYYYEMHRDRLKAIRLAMQAVTEGKEHVNEDPDIRTVVNLLKDNLDAWMSGLDSEDVRELDRLEGARKWFGKEAAVPTERLVHRLSEEPPPKLTIAATLRQRHNSIPQPYLVPSLVRYPELEPFYVCNHYPFLQRDFPELYQPILDASKPLYIITEPQTTTAVVTTTVAVSIAATMATSTASTAVTTTTTTATTNAAVVTSAIPRVKTITVFWDPSPTTVHPLSTDSASALVSPYEEQATTSDPFEGILQPTLSSTSSNASPQPLEDDDDDDDVIDDDYLELIQSPYYRSSVPRTSSPRNIPGANLRPLTPAADRDSIFSRSGLIGQLRRFEYRMHARPGDDPRMERSPPHRRGVWRNTPPDEEENDSAEELPKGTRVTVVAEPQTPPKIVISTKYPSAGNIVQHASATDVRFSFGVQAAQTVSQSSAIPQPQSQQQTVFGMYATETQRQYTAVSSEQSDISTQLQHQHATAHRKSGQSTSQQKDENASGTEAANRLGTHEHLALPESAQTSTAPLVVLTASGPNIIGDYFVDPSLEDTPAAIPPSQSSPDKPKSSEKPTNSVHGQQMQACSIQPSTKQTTSREPMLNSQQGSNHQRASYTPQQSSENRGQGKLIQHKLLRRSFSAPRAGATWPLLTSLVREPPFYIQKVLRRASAPDGKPVGRQFLSVHSSAEELYDEAAEKAFADPWAPFGTRTMRNTFPIASWHPGEEPHVPWIRFHWSCERKRNVQNPKQQKSQFADFWEESLEQKEQQSSPFRKSGTAESSDSSDIPALVDGSSSDPEQN